MEKINISHIVANWKDAETIDAIDKLLAEIVSVFCTMKSNNNLYDANICKKLYYIRSKLSIKRHSIKHARKERIRYISKLNNMDIKLKELNINIILENKDNVLALIIVNKIDNFIEQLMNDNHIDTNYCEYNISCE